MDRLRDRGRGRPGNWLVGVLLGGLSAESKISRATGREVVKALRQKGYRVLPIEVKRDVGSRLRRHKVKVVFNALHGKIGEDGCIQGLLEVMGIPYTGSGVAASALSMDKVLAKELFIRKGIPTPPYRAVSGGVEMKGLGLPWPVVVKPRCEGSTLGVTIVRARKDLAAAVRKALQYDPACLIEQYIPGKEIAVGLIDGKALGAIEIHPVRGFYDFRTKYTPGLARHIYPARLDRKVYQKALKLAEQASRALGCEGTPRVDLRVTPRGKIYVLEVNALPGLTPISLLPEIARGEDVAFPDLVERILDSARLKTAIGRPRAG